METIYPVITAMDMQLPFYVTGVGCQKNQENVNRPSGFMHYQWACCRKGEGCLEIGGNIYSIPVKTGFFFRPGIPHKYYAVKEPWEVQWLTFDGHALPSLLDYLGIGDWEVSPDFNSEYFYNIAMKITTHLKNKKSNSLSECSALLYTFLTRTGVFAGKKGNDEYNDRLAALKPAISFMEKNLSSDISLTEIAQVIGVTPSHLCRMFKKCYNMSVFQFLTNMRIQKSKQLLTQHPGMKIKEISKKAGYNDASYFSMVFKKLEGITPQEFRGTY